MSDSLPETRRWRVLAAMAVGTVSTVVLAGFILLLAGLRRLWYPEVSD